MSWWSGSEGTQTLAGFVEKYRARCREGYPEWAGEYRPWMSDARFRGLPWQRPAEAEPAVISTDNLRTLRAAVFASGAQPFGVFSPSIHHFEIAEGGAGASEEFANGLGRALALLRTHAPGFARRLETLVLEFIPLRANGSFRLRPMGAGSSLHWYRGGVFLSLPEPFPYRNWELAINIAHELGHQALMIYQSGDPVLASPLDQPIYSAIRKTERPAIASLHAVAALSSMREFLHEVRVDALPAGEREFLAGRREEIRADLLRGLRALGSVRGTPLGEVLLAEMGEVSR